MHFCIDCNEEKADEAFYPSHIKRGRRARCKPHAQARCNAYARAPEAKRKRREYERARTKRDPSVNRAVNLKYKYGITPEQYAAMVAAQGGHCAICGGGPKGRWAALFVDHDHSTGNKLRGKPRGLLCFPCNSSLGGFKDSPELLRRALAYLERHANPTKPIEIPDSIPV